eukprot:GHVS01078565.1.p1 GENE.GHVS01078565.1~~GHVS01078565.1.p1  ORF type:complete len:337 (+),score=54.15 GHVS01078565.1:175-1185(+)
MHTKQGSRAMYTVESTDAFTGIHEEYLEDVTWGDEEEKWCEGGEGWRCCAGRGEEEGKRLLLGALEVEGEQRRQEHSRFHRCLVCIQRLVERVFCLFAVITVGIGIAVLVIDGHYLYSENYFIFIYISITLIGELCILLCICVLMLLLKVCVGEVYSAHANAMCGISLKLLQGLYYYMTVGIGLFLLFQYRHSWAYPATISDLQFAFTVPAQTTSTSTSTPPNGTASLQPSQLPIASFVYVASVVSLSLVFTLQSCPVIAGALGWLWHKVQMKLLCRDEVAFLHPAAPISYADIDQYRRALDNMTHPLIVFVRNTTPQQTERQQTEHQQEQLLERG